MSTGTYIIETALSHIGAHSVISPARPESLEAGKNGLNSMIARWIGRDIEIGAVPLEVIGDELCEPLEFTNTIIFNLAIEIHPLFPGSQLSPTLQTSANRTFQDMLIRARKVTIPKPVVRDTLPLGQGNKRGNTGRDRTFFAEGETLGD